eukprot:GHUV01035447.1.p1 GENE.GHUV01035447.1~~GHUV01035447.1.p1  ORF type:complete len:163 (-),score=7.59 GHUV01035447.1:804-1292(-)
MHVSLRRNTHASTLALKASRQCRGHISRNQACSPSCSILYTNDSTQEQSHLKFAAMKYSQTHVFSEATQASIFPWDLQPIILALRPLCQYPCSSIQHPPPASHLVYCRNLFDYDQVINTQRDRVYSERRRALLNNDLSPLMMEYAEKTCDDILEVGCRNCGS